MASTGTAPPKLRYNCYLLRPGLTSVESALRPKYRPGGAAAMAQVPPSAAAPEGAIAYLGTSDPKTPKWAVALSSMFSGISSLTNAANRVVVFLPVSERWFAICFGYGSSALNWDAVESNFGLRVAARRFRSNGGLSELRSRRIDQTARTQSVNIPAGGDLRDLGVELEGEFVRKLVGELDGGGIADGAHGAVVAGDSIAFKASTQLDVVQQELASMLDDLSGAARPEFSFIDSLEPLRGSQAIVDDLNKRLAARVLKSDVTLPNSVTGLSDHVLEFAPPDDVRVDEVDEYVVINGNREAAFEEGTLGALQTALAEVGVQRGKSFLKNVRVMARGADGEAKSNALSVLNWLVYETGTLKDRFVLTLGRWFRLNEDYSTKLNADLMKIADVTALLGLPAWQAKDSETTYNVKAPASNSKLLHMDRQMITPSEGGSVEACDLLHEDGHLIHVKRYNKSQTMSHLFAQGSVSVELLNSDDDFKADFVAKVTTKGSVFADVAKKAPEVVTFAIGLADQRGLPLDLPIFSKVNLRDHAKRIRAAGVTPTLARIDIV